MTLANVVVADTFSTWLARTNQMVVLWNTLTDGTVLANNISANTITVTSWASVAGMNLVPTIQAAFLQANTGTGAYGTANSATTIAVAAFTQANTANVRAYNDVLKIGDTMTGNLVMLASNIAFPTAATGLTFGPNSSILSPTPNVISFVTAGIERLNLSSTGALANVTNVIWVGTTSGQVNVRANATTTTYQLTLPAAAGSINAPVVWLDAVGSLGTGVTTGTGNHVLSANAALTGTTSHDKITANSATIAGGVTVTSGSGKVVSAGFATGTFNNNAATTGTWYQVIPLATIAANGDGVYLLFVGNTTATLGGTYVMNYNDGFTFLTALQIGTSSFLQLNGGNGANSDLQGMQNQTATGTINVTWLFVPRLT